MIYALRESLPGCDITIVSRPGLVPLWQQNDYSKEIIPFDIFDKTTGVRDYLRLFTKLRGKSFDLAIILPSCLQWSLISLCAGIRYRIGFSNNTGSLLLSNKLANDRDRKIHIIANYMRIARAIGIEGKEYMPQLMISDRYVNFANDFFKTNNIDKQDIVIGLAPAAAYGPAKRWPEEYFADLADRLIDSYKAKVIIFGSQFESDIGCKVSGLMRNAHVNLVSKTDLMEAAGLINKCSLFITNDSGLMHIASALGVRLIAIFGSTSPLWTGPCLKKSVILKKDLPCSPCFSRTCHFGSYKCLTSITVEEAFEAAIAQLKNNSPVGLQ